MKRVGLLLACLGVLGAALGVSVDLSRPAYAAEIGYTDGTQCQGPLCPGGPPPTDPVFAQGEECKTDIIDPPSYVYITEHFVYGTTPPPAGVVPVVADAHGVFPYHGVAPALFPIDIEAFVAGKQGFRADTWNIGKGVTAWVPFDCRPPETTTTTSTTTTTVEPTTTTSTTIEGATTTTAEPTTTTSIENLGTTTSIDDTTTTSVGSLGSSTTTVQGAASGTLPFTGGGGGLIPVALITAGSGLALLLGAKHRRAARARR